MRKPVLRVSDQVRHKPGCTTTEDGLRLEILDYSAIYVVKTNGLILVLVFLHMQNSGFLMTEPNFVSNILCCIESFNYLTQIIILKHT